MVKRCYTCSVTIDSGYYCDECKGLPGTFTEVDNKPLKIVTGKKYDDNKPDLSLLPRKAKEGISRAFMDGEKKYGRYNYLNGMEWTRLLAAVERHLAAFSDGEDLAQDSGLNHLYHAGAGIMMLIEYYDNKLGTDNRYKKDGPK